MEYSEEKKKSCKGWIIFLIILVVLMGSYIGYDKYNQYKDKNKEKNVVTELNNKIKVLESNQKTTDDEKCENDNFITTSLRNAGTEINTKYNVYAIGYSTFVYADDNYFYGVSSFIGSSFHNDKTRFKSNNAILNSNGNDQTVIHKFDIKEADISKIQILHKAGTKDASEQIFFIFKDGSVKMSEYNVSFNSLTTVFSGYKIDDVTGLGNCITKSNNDAYPCDKYGYAVKLLDGTTKDLPLK